MFSSLLEQGFPDFELKSIHKNPISLCRLGLKLRSDNVNRNSSVHHNKHFPSALNLITDCDYKTRPLIGLLAVTFLQTA